MFGSRKKRPLLTKAEALRACPVKVPAVSEELKEGKLLVTVEYERPSWQRALGSERLCRRTYGLDEYGREVYGCCTGDVCVEKIIRKFADKHGISHSESELAVTEFLKTLMSRGLVGMSLNQKKT